MFDTGVVFELCSEERGGWLSWPADWPADRLTGRLPGWAVRCLAGPLGDGLAAWLAGMLAWLAWLAGCLAGLLAVYLDILLMCSVYVTFPFHGKPNNRPVYQHLFPRLAPGKWRT